MATYERMMRYCTPEQIAKAQLLGITIWQNETYGTYWVSKFPAAEGHDYMLLTDENSSSVRHWWPDVDTALERAASPAKYGLKWI